ncbi:hypothetical protein [Nevskia ramosa]|uniref:hypothetical protein n=1 Tax=Nevskia ramosa TaxID=64002 RepID=UPI003D0F085F
MKSLFINVFSSVYAAVSYCVNSKFAASLMALALALTFSLMPPEAAAQVAALDASTAISYLEDNASTNMTQVGVVVFTLAGLAMAITWVKATFFG